MARPQEMPATLGEVMGNKVPQDKQLTMDDLPALLGDVVPDIEFNLVGRMRLLTALQKRFGDSFRNIKGAKEVLADFDKEMKVRKVIRKNVSERKPKEAK